MIAQAEMFPEVRLRPEDDPDSRFTPWALIRELEREQGHGFDLDVAASAESTKAPRYYTKADNGLMLPWAGHVWCNPPFSDIEPWVQRAWAQIGFPALSITMLLPAWTDRAWWHQFVEPHRDRGGLLTTRFLPGRIRFGIPGNPDGVGADSPPFWCVLLRWRK